jgi:ubiquinone/menaquinone biosynthesis C-methylase UbiE
MKGTKEKSPLGKKEILDYWDQKAKELKELPQATMRDFQLRLLEIDLILGQLNDNDEVLDVGCGNGFATAIFSEKVKNIVGIDFSSEMIDQANVKLTQEQGNKNNISFQQMDVLNLSYPEGTFDVVISERCLINLRTWEEQQKAMLEIKRVLKTGGRYLMIEGTSDGLDKLNNLRESVGLHGIEKHWHNLLFDDDMLMAFLKKQFNIKVIISLGTYYFISRVVHPLMVSPDEPKFEAKINEVARRIAADIPSFDDISINKLYVLSKNGL